MVECIIFKSVPTHVPNKVLGECTLSKFDIEHIFSPLMGIILAVVGWLRLGPVGLLFDK